ncbi:hypothetical protein HJC10_30575 [Corallococcus exiguus]|uniref:hypothetical protein n=1 Tax=Corallococcus exiguus TaxID=83462 RepID=UPI0014717DA7|nr:hypothetical protein [Corallococcus exiguus]NNB87399.1 hypothetical protein [Corallococcus exiguus]NNB97760.1 hypothetical protein [Corallococcus exiguus]NNC07182.1 hypothetical protein [Corallococcus exiguus]
MTASNPFRPSMLAALVLVVCGVAAAEDKDDESSLPGPELGPCKVYESSSKGSSLRCPKRADPFRGDNTGLRVGYQIGGVAPKQAEVFEDKTTWLVHIPERVLPGDTLSLKLEYLYVPSDTARDALKADLELFYKTVTADITEALREHGEEWKSHSKITPTQSQFKILESARTKSNAAALPQLLKGLGFRPDADAQQWSPTEKTLELINEDGQKGADSGLLSKKKFLDETRKGALKCSELLGLPPPSETRGDLLPRASQCLKKLHFSVDAETATEKAGPPAGAASLDGTTCKQLFNESALDNFNKATSEADIKTASEALLTAQRDPGNVCPKTTEDHLASVISLLTLARHVAATEQAQEALQEQLDSLGSQLAVTVDLPDTQSQFLHSEAERRGYSISSGAVYLFGLNDLVYPVAISICPIGGCLRGDEQFWHNSGKNVWRSFSAEVGVAAVTADKFDDARRRGGPGFLLGLSWQGLAPFKLSGGSLVFENQENRRWQVDGYFGLTLDAAKAVEMMGLFGINVPTQLKSVGSKTTP